MKEILMEHMPIFLFVLLILALVGAMMFHELRMEPQVRKVDGHEYLTWQKTIIHSESCPCRK